MLKPPTSLVIVCVHDEKGSDFLDPPTWAPTGIKLDCNLTKVRYIYHQSNRESAT